MNKGEQKKVIPINKESVSIQEITLTSYFDLFESEIKRKRVKNQSGLPSFNNAVPYIDGLTIIGAEPKVGKSILMMQLATDYAGRDIPCIYYDFEMGPKRVLRRLFERDFGRMPVDAEKMEDERFSIQLTDFQEVVKRLSGRLFYRGGKNIQDKVRSDGHIFYRDIENVRNYTGENFICIFIDSLQKLPFIPGTDRRTNIDTWLRLFESMKNSEAQDISLALFVITELSRNGQYKESGDIEYSADTCIEIISPQEVTEENKNIYSLYARYCRDYEVTGQICMIQRKNWKFVELANENGDGVW